MKTASLRGAFLALLAFTVFACSDALTKLAGLGDIPVTVIVMISGWGAIITILLYASVKRDFKILRPKKWRPYALLTAIFIAQTYAAVGAFTNLPLTTVYIGIFSAPFIISIIGALFMKEALSRYQIYAIILGFIGVMVALIPEFLSAKTQEIGNPMLGYICLPFFLGLYITGMLLLRIVGRTEAPESITFISFLGRGTLLLPILFFEPISQIPLESIFYMLGMGVMASIGFVLMSRAYQLAPVAIVSPLHYSQLIVGAIFGYLLWDTVPHLWVWVGGAIIIISGLMIAHEAHQRGQEEPEL